MRERDSTATTSGTNSTPPTLTDVAALAGVGVMTASRVISGAVRVGPDRTRRVLEAAAELGYRRNENARSIRPGQRTGLVGVVITNASNPYYAEMQAGVEQVLFKHDMRMLVGNTGEDVTRERKLIADYIGWNVDGLIVVPSGTDTTQLSSLPVPVVLASRPLEGINLDTVLIDDIGGSRDGTGLLLAEGHRRIAFVGHGMSVSTSRRRLDGFTQAFAAAGMQPDPDLVLSGRPERDAALVAVRRLLSIDDPPSAFFSANNRNTIAILHALKERGSSTGPEARVVAFDNFDTADLMSIPLSVVDHDPQEMGRNAAQLLINRLADQSFSKPAAVIELPTRLIR